MYRYDDYDQHIVNERVEQFRDQVRRRLSGELKEEEFMPLRLQNGLYMQIHGYMLRIAVPYGLVSSKQMRMFAHIARTYDRGYGHFTTRQNIQFNWLRLQDIPNILADLASVEMHAIQTSGNCVRNITSDEYAGVAQDEVVDPRPYAEVLRQWSTFHPEFAYLPRKFKIAISGGQQDRAAIYAHDIGLAATRNAQGEIGFRVLVGGGLGRTPIIGSEICEFVPWQHLLTYVESILRIYNQYGRRDNKYKARIKILVKALGIDEFKRQVEADWADIKNGPGTLTAEEVERVASFFIDPDYETLTDHDSKLSEFKADSRSFSNWMLRNVKPHRVPGYAIVVLSLKKPGETPGDATTEQMEVIADLADRYSGGEVRITHQQNLVLADVRQKDLIRLWQEASRHELTSPNIGLLTDIISCPGAEFCTLANARSIPLAKAIAERFEDLDFQHDIGEITLNISGCVNACGQHHIGNIGITGVEKKDHDEWYQVSLGGAEGNDSSIGKIIGPSFTFHQVPEVIDRLLQVYLRERIEAERFIDTVRRIGQAPFKEHVYATDFITEDDDIANKHVVVPAQYSVPYYSPRF
ncbi:nitrite/sulfite reductase [Nitrosomonas sp. JL21]|uniref:nitrite/sulfite reductase n=1 Tax=Nitrosomonas sp. JL21 TaxID=153949 RepID=UPI001369A076|nr:nitrite/sulfite reductase [Nitrosomonas sp. JL21]MBL8496728.1 nitrite/sulfite reductase [Nitrosomonas sp.]MCC7091107.1 nitrite/sulfite reductase [Nitrosomonas sp.]MXS76534.1 nitrite/sulfite reductase [Nitrosomonas sp. JL21]